MNPSVLEAHSTEKFSGERVGITGSVPRSFFWGQPLSAGFKDELYREFKNYVLKRIDRNDLSLDIALRSQLDELKAALASAGLDKVAVGVEDLRPKIRAAVLEDMDKNKRYITDGVELALLSRELPDRLIAYHTIIQDEQVHSAVELVSGKQLPLMTETAGKGSDILLQEKEKAGLPPKRALESITVASGSKGSSATASYDSLLFGL